ncbi:MAG TPA: thiamine pyrophosphate-dependent enzyme [bacterium]|nr:thiamine pyrophosphate-dependent enzyme [bacterium]
MAEDKVWTSSAEVTWCPGCGNFGILNALRQALTESGLEPWQVVVVGGIGQSGKVAQYVGANFLHGLHGRALPHALGVKLANPALKVIAVGGDGDMYGEGGNHLLHAFRRNPDIVCLVHNNGVYGLTKGQAAPTSGYGFATKNRPTGTVLPAFNPLAAGLALGGSFVARGFAGDVKHLSRLIGEALKHKGFGFIDILQPCVTYNLVNTFDWYRTRVYDLALEAHDASDEDKARARVLEWPCEGEAKQIPIGIFYRSHRQAYEACGASEQPAAVSPDHPHPSLPLKGEGTEGRGWLRQALSQHRDLQADAVDVVKRALEEFV